MIPRFILFLLSLTLLSACDNAAEPERFSEVATQGVYSIRINHSGNAAFIGSLHHGGSYWTLDPAERHFDWNHTGDGYSNLTSGAFSPDDATLRAPITAR